MGKSNVSGQQSVTLYNYSYYLASAADDSVVKLWDLRKLKNFKTIELEPNYQVWSAHCLVALSWIGALALTGAVSLL